VQLISRSNHRNIPAMKSVVVTGTSTGVGRGVAKVLVGKGFRVFGSVRSQADADSLKAELGANLVPLVFDITDEAAVYAAAREVRDALAGETLCGLVNNAGIAVAGVFFDLKPEDYRRQFEVNFIGQVIVTQAFLPLLGTDLSLKGPPGRIIMISSVGGQNASPFMSPYNASKFALEGLSESLRRELMPFGIDVIIVGPGAVRTRIWAHAGMSDVSRYRNSPYGKALETARAFMQKMGTYGVSPESVGELVHHVLTTPAPRVRYAIVPNRRRYYISRMLPKRLIDRIYAKRLGFKRRQLAEE
jgi:NAD(P)-dependent dehydrogenase (short-subunit alcohol dehydrogenase family)